MANDRYNALKAMGKCVVCGKNPADDGFTTCLVCRLDRRGKKDKHSTESIYHHRQWLKRLRDLRYAFGVCIVCGKRDAVIGSSMCSVCLAKARIRAKDKRIKDGVLPREVFWDGHHCTTCGTEIDGTQKKLCENCYPKYRELMLYARRFKTEQNYFEKLNKAWWNEKNADK